MERKESIVKEMETRDGTIQVVVDRLVNKILEKNGVNAVVTLEGTPIYIDREWTPQHAFAYNKLLPMVRERLGKSWVQVNHLALFDNLNVCEERLGDWDISQVEHMVDKPSGIVFENDLVDIANAKITTFNGRLIRVNGRTELNIGMRTVPVRNINENPTCEILDAHFQLAKRCDATVVVHPTQFRDQQKEMRLLLREINGGQLPFYIYTIYTTEKNGVVNISTTTYMDREGKEHAI